MPPSKIAFDRVVAERLARIADGDKRVLPSLTACAGAWILEHAATLIDIAQRGHASMAEALELTVESMTEMSVLEALFKQLPKRTIILRNFSVSVARKLSEAVPVEHMGLQTFLLRSQLSGRSREGGRPLEALVVLKDAIASPLFPSLPASVRAHFLSNLATCMADIGENAQSFEIHLRVIEMLERGEDNTSAETDELLLNELGNAAAASLRVQEFDKADAFLIRAEEKIESHPDRGLAFRLQTLRFALYAEKHDFRRALELGRQMLPVLEDFEEASYDVYRSFLIDALVNVGSVAMDEFLSEEASEYFARAYSLASRVMDESDTPQARLKVLTTRLAVLTAQLQEGRSEVAGPVRQLLAQSRVWLEENENAYALEIHRRILELVVRATTEDDHQTPSREEIAELVENEQASSVETSEEAWVITRTLHTAALAYSKLCEKESALRMAREAVKRSSAASATETVHDRAQRAVLVDSLSRRLEENGDIDGALNQAEAALEIIEPCWQQMDKYTPWIERMFFRFRELAGRKPEARRLENFLGRRGM